MQLKIIAALVLAAILAFSNVMSYYKGKDVCRQEQIEAARNETPQAVAENVQRADNTAAGFRDMEQHHATAQERLNSSVDAHSTPSECNLSADELRDFQQLTELTGSRVPVPSARTVQAPQAADVH